MGKQIYRYTDDTNRLWKITEHCRRARKYWEKELNNISG